MSEVKDLRDQARSLHSLAQDAIEKGETEQAKNMAADAVAKIEKAAELEGAEKQMKVLTEKLETRVQEVPVASTDVAKYNPDDTTAKTKADYKPATYIQGLPESAQPRWVFDQMGSNLQEIARFKTNAFVEWMKYKSDRDFDNNAAPDIKKAMQESDDAEGGYGTEMPPVLVTA